MRNAEVLLRLLPEVRLLREVQQEPENVLRVAISAIHSSSSTHENMPDDSLVYTSTNYLSMTKRI